MKKILLVIFSVVISVIAGCNVSVEDNATENILNNNTVLFIQNSTSDSVLVFLTLGNGGDTNYVQDVNGIFGITTTGSQGSFMLHSNDTFSYCSPSGKGLNGNLCFTTAPINCADTTFFPSGINIFEFTLNNNFNTDAQETIEISCVSGVNSYIIGMMNGGGVWNAGVTQPSVDSIYNLNLYNNTGLVGVYPYGCDDCDSIASPPFCAGHKPYATPQSNKICNVQRPSTTNGGSVVVTFNGLVINEICSIKEK